MPCLNHLRLESLLAQQDVHVSAKSGMAAAGDELRVAGAGDDQRVTLLGPKASVSDGGNTIVAQNIKVSSAVTIG